MNNQRTFWILVALAIVVVFFVAPTAFNSLFSLLSVLQSLALTAMGITVTIYLWKRM